jgi:membrane fusion protein (multidrug efflux system)
MSVLRPSNWKASLAAALILGFISVEAGAQTTPEMPPPAVETIAVKLAPVTRDATFVGTVAAIQSVDIRARVEGFLSSVNFQEGSFVKAGTLLFEIEKDTYQAALDGAQATLAASQATEAGSEVNLRQAEITLTRQSKLLSTNAVAKETVDQSTANRDAAAATVKQSQAQVAEAKAQVKTAALNLSYTDVITPISGRIGKAQITVGNLVSSNSGPLATVIQTDPIRVVFSISDREYLQVVDKLKPSNDTLSADADRYHPQLQLPDGKTYGLPGKIAFIDNKIDPTTGTIAVYAEFPNPNLQLVPGQYVSVIVQQGNAVELPVVAAAAVQQDREGNYVFVLGEDNRATIRRITLGNRVGTDWAVASGLASGDVVIKTGIQKVKPGMVVDPHAAAAGN